MEGRKESGQMKGEEQEGKKRDGDEPEGWWEHEGEDDERLMMLFPLQVVCYYWLVMQF